MGRRAVTKTLVYIRYLLHSPSFHQHHLHHQQFIWSESNLDALFLFICNRNCTHWYLKTDLTPPCDPAQLILSLLKYNNECIIAGLVSVFPFWGVKSKQCVPGKGRFPSCFLMKSIFICDYNNPAFILIAVPWGLIPPCHPPSDIRMSSGRQPEKEGGSDSKSVSAGCEAGGVRASVLWRSGLWCQHMPCCFHSARCRCAAKMSSPNSFKKKPSQNIPIMRRLTQQDPQDHAEFRSYCSLKLLLFAPGFVKSDDTFFSLLFDRLQ